MKKELGLKELQNCEFDILKATDRYCRKLNIKIMLAYGTLLGAVRHGGFIPWDDDVDVYILRDEYEKLIASLKDGMIDDRYRLSFYRNDNPYDYPFCKIVDTFTELEEKGHDTKTSVYIDLFPLEYAGDKDSVLKATRKLKRLKEFLSASYKHYVKPKSTVRHFVKMLFRPFCRLAGSKRLNQYIDEFAIQYNEKYRNSETLVNLVWEENKYISYRTSAFKNPTELEFCGQKFFVPENYENVLEQTYGDYMKLPVESERVGHMGKACLRKEL